MDVKKSGDIIIGLGLVLGSYWTYHLLQIFNLLISNLVCVPQAENDNENT